MKDTNLNASSCWKRIQKLCKEHGILQKNLVTELGLLDQTIRNKISRNAFPSIEELVMIADYFNVSTDFLLLGKLSEHEENKVLEEKLNKISEIINEPISDF